MRYLALLLALSGCVSSYQVRTTFVNKPASGEVKIIETEQTVKGRASLVYAFYTKVFKFVTDEMTRR